MHNLSIFVTWAFRSFGVGAPNTTAITRISPFLAVAVKQYFASVVNPVFNPSTPG